MRRFTALLFVASLAIPALCHADVLQPGSSFNVGLLENNSFTNLAQANALLTPGGSTSFTFNGANVTASESEATLPGGQDQILITVTSSGDLFPGNSSDSGYLGVGNLTPMQFTTPFDLTSAVLTFGSPSGAYVSSNVIGFVSQQDPFDGEFAAYNLYVGYGGLGGLDTTSITLALTGTPIAATPEPSSLALLGTTLVGLAGVMRKRFA
jgi:hypothetical protein